MHMDHIAWITAIQMLTAASLELTANFGLYFLCFQCRIYKDCFAENGGVRHEERFAIECPTSSIGQRVICLHAKADIRTRLGRRLVKGWSQAATAPNETKEIVVSWIAHREGTG